MNTGIRALIEEYKNLMLHLSAAFIVSPSFLHSFLPISTPLAKGAVVGWGSS